MDPLYKIINGFRRCPYNPSHTVLAIRFIGHLLKCAEKSSIKLLVCPWNATHHVHPEDYKTHMTTCENQELLDGIGDVAVPDSAFVRDYKMIKNMEQNDPEKDIVNLGGNVPVMLYYEPINTSHDYEVELYNRRFQTQEFCYRDVDEFDAPPPTVNATGRYDLYGRLIESDAPPRVDIEEPPLVEDDDPTSSEESSVQDDESSEVSARLDEDVDRADDRGAGFWSSHDVSTVCVVDNKQFYYGRRLKYESSDQESSPYDDEQYSTDDLELNPQADGQGLNIQTDDQKLNLQTDGQELNLQTDAQSSNEQMIDNDQFTDAASSSDDKSFVALDTANKLSRPHKNVCHLQVDFRSNEHFMGNFPSACNTSHRVGMKEPQLPTVAMSSLRLGGGEQRGNLSRVTVTRPTMMALVSDGVDPTSPPVSAQGARTVEATQENVAVKQGLVGTLITGPRVVSGSGRGYQLQKLYDNLQQVNKVPSEPEEVQSSSNSAGHGRGVLRRKLNEFQLGKTVGRCQTTSTSGNGT